MLLSSTEQLYDKLYGHFNCTPITIDNDDDGGDDDDEEDDDDEDDDDDDEITDNFENS